MFDREDVEDIILCMADIVLENRNLRAKQANEESYERKYNQLLADVVAESEQSSRDLLKACLLGCFNADINVREVEKPDMTFEEAMEKLKGTTVSIFKTDSGKYHWFAIMSESSFPFDTVREAYEEAADYLKRGGY